MFTASLACAEPYAESTRLDGERVSSGRASVKDKNAALRGGAIPGYLSLVPLYPERLAAIQAIVDVESTRAKGKRRFCIYPYTAAFFRRLTGTSKVNGKALKCVTGLIWDPRERLATLNDYERAFDVLISSRGKYCPTPLSYSVRDWLFPEVKFQQTERDKKHFELQINKKIKITERRRQCQETQEAIEYARVVQQAWIDLNFQSPDTFCEWNVRHPDLKVMDWLDLFWRWQARFPSLAELEWYRYSSTEQLDIIVNLKATVIATPDVIRVQERLFVPNKLSYSGP